MAGTPRHRRRLPDGGGLDHPERHRRPLGGVGRGEHPRLDLRSAQAQGDLRHQRPADEGPLLRRLELSGGRLRQGLRRHRLQGRRADGRRPARPHRRDGAPTFITAAIWDDHIKTKLQQIQIVKGWVDDAGQHARAGLHRGRRPRQPAQPPGGDRPRRPARPGRSSAASASARSGRTPTSTRASTRSTTCAVLEEPVCRYSTLWCRKWIGVDPLDTDKCNTQLAALQNGTPQKAKASRAPCAARTRPPTPSCSR